MRADEVKPRHSALIDVDDSLCQKISHCIKTAFYCFCGFWLFDHLIEKSGHTIVDYINE